MLKDYHYIFRCVLELQKEISGKRIVEIYSQEKDKLFFRLPSDSEPNNGLILSCNPQIPYVQVRKELHKARKNSVNFFESLLPTVVQDVRIADGDRIINISTTSGEIFFFIRGSKTNIVVLDKEGEIHSFKKLTVPGSSLIKELLENEFLTEYHSSEFNLPTYQTYKSIKKDLPFLSRKLHEELIFQNEENNKNINITLNECIDAIIYDDISVGFNLHGGSIEWQPVSFKNDEIDNIKTFGTYNSALSYYIANYYRNQDYNKRFKFLSGFLEKQVSVFSNRLNNLKVRLDKGCRDDIYYKYGQLLLVNLKTISPCSKQVELTDYLTGKELKIKLDPKKNVQENANQYFDKAKDEKKNYAKSKELFNSTRLKYDMYIKYLKELESVNSIDDLIFIEEQLNIKQEMNKNKVDDQINYREFILSNKYHVFVGKDSKSNDMLTVKMAKQNDYWFHARGYSGSHVVLRVDNPKEGIPKNILNNVASIAAFYSKAKTAGIAPVAYTLRKYVRKNKNMNPGQVIVTKEKVLHVKPEIPKNAEVTE